MNVHVVESFTADHKPLLGEDPVVRGFYHGVGFNSSGMMLSKLRFVLSTPLVV